MREVVIDPALPICAVVIDTSLCTDHFDTATDSEIVTGEAAFFVQIKRFEHVCTPIDYVKVWGQRSFLSIQQLFAALSLLR